jgi:hypothetical protein
MNNGPVFPKVQNIVRVLLPTVPWRNGLYQVDHSVEGGGEMGGLATEVLTEEELHHHMGHITPEATKCMISKHSVKGIELDNSSKLKAFDSCKYAKATQKPIKKSREKPRASKFGEEIHSDLWGPSPVQTPGKKEYYATFTDNHTRWTHLNLLRKKDEIFNSIEVDRLSSVF